MSLHALGNFLATTKFKLGLVSVEQKNLKDLLVPSSLPDTVQENCTDSDNIGCYRCHPRVCDACQNFLVPAKRIKSVVTRKSYKIRQSLSCRIDYVIYCARCTLCNRQYVGSCINFSLSGAPGDCIDQLPMYHS